MATLTGKVSCPMVTVQSTEVIVLAAVEPAGRENKVMLAVVDEIALKMAVGPLPEDGKST